MSAAITVLDRHWNMNWNMNRNMLHRNMMNRIGCWNWDFFHNSHRIWRRDGNLLDKGNRIWSRNRNTLVDWNMNRICDLFNHWIWNGNLLDDMDRVGVSVA